MITPLSLTEELLFTTVRIETDLQSGVRGVGTGFFFNAKVDENQTRPLIITNKHVVSGAARGRFRLHEAVHSGPTLRPSGASFTVQFENFESLWVHHPHPSVDLCAMPFPPPMEFAEATGKSVFYKSFNDSLVLRDEQLAALNAVEDVLMVGYPIGLWDETNNLPLVRRGITASHPAIDFDGQPQFVIDAACFPGSSGSPVVLANLGSYYEKTGALVVGNRFALLGVLYAGFTMTAEGRIMLEPIPTAPVVQSSTMIHLGRVIKAKEILTLAQYIIRTLRLSSTR